MNWNLSVCTLGYVRRCFVQVAQTFFSNWIPRWKARCYYLVQDGQIYMTGAIFRPRPVTGPFADILIRGQDVSRKSRLANSGFGHSGAPSPPSLSPLSLLPFPRGPHPVNQLGGPGERCKLLQWGLGRSPSRQTIWCTAYLSQNEQLWCRVYSRHVAGGEIPPRKF